MHCHACGEIVEEDSRFCRHCGASQPIEGEPAASGASAAPLNDLTAPDEPPGQGSATPLLLVGGGIILLFLLLLILTRPASTPSASSAVPDNAGIAVENGVIGTEATTVDVDDPPLANVQAAPEKPGGAWSYRSKEDKVRGGTSYFATTTSTNSVDLDPPYEGGSTLEMMARKSPAYGSDLLLILSSGQLLCHAYDGCYATVRFDDAPAERFALNEPSDNSSDTVFVADAEGFIAKLKRAKHVVLEVEIYQAGRPQFEFDVEGLDWEH